MNTKANVRQRDRFNEPKTKAPAKKMKSETKHPSVGKKATHENQLIGF